MDSDGADWIRRPGEGRYAKPEIERRFLLTDVPVGADSPRLIEDRYITGTRLRLRRVQQDSQVVYKLCQKVRPNTADASTVALTNMYLSASEYERLRVLPAASLRKTRRRLKLATHAFAIDEFHDGLEGLWLAEIEVESLDDQIPTGRPLGAEVTGDRFSGGYLALADAAVRAELLRFALTGSA